jgi:hypothetical protein
MKVSCSFSRPLHCLLVLAALAQCACSEDHKPAGRFISQVNDPSARYQGLVASFGNRLEEDLKVNIMLPPDHQNDPYLCSYPAILENISGDDEIKMRAGNISEPVALLVAVGGPCSTEAKARMMLRMQKTVSSQLKVLFLYETDQKFSNWFVSLAPESPEVSPEFDNVAIVYVPFRQIAQVKVQLSAVTVGNPLLLQDHNELWRFEHLIEGSWLPIGPGSSATNPDTDHDDAYDFYWIRYVLFFLLMCSPCFRAGFLFHMGGGRIGFRRSEEGRILGFRYTPYVGISSGCKIVSSRVL